MERGNQRIISSLEGTDSVYRLIFETMKEAALTVTFDGKILFSNHQFSELVETPLERVIGRPLKDFVAKGAQKSLALLLRESQSHSVKGRVVFQGAGRAVPAQVSACLLTQPDGLSICIVATDLSELETSTEMVQKLRQQQEFLRQSLERFEVLSETASELLQSRTPQLIIRSLCLKIMGILDCQLFFNYLVDHQKKRLFLNAFAGIPNGVAARIELLENETAICSRVAREGVRIVAESIEAGKDPQTDFVGSFGIKAYACQPLITQGGIIGALSFGTRTRPTFSTGDLALIKTVADQVAIALERVRTEEAAQRVNMELERRVQQRTADLATNVKKLLREASIRIKTAEQLRKTNTELERRAHQLRRLASELTLAEQRERRRLAQMLHDHLQQLLFAAQLRTELLLQTSQDESRQVVREVRNLLGESIDLSRSLTAEFSPPNLHEGGLVPALHWLVRWIKTKHGLTVRLSAREPVAPAGEDVAVLLFQAVRELLFNVVKHGRVKSATVQIGQRGGALEIVVGDKGAGFKVARLQQPDASEGFGLFSISERLSLIGGEMQIKSAPGKGSQCLLRVPLSHLQAASSRSGATLAVGTRNKPPATANVPGSTMRKIRLLLVDDHQITRKGLVQLLKRRSDIEVVGEADDGEAAVRLAKQLRPDVVLMDVSMPGMNGIEATRIIHQQLPSIQIVGLSMYEEADRGSAMREAGASEYVTKSGSPDALIAVIRACLSRLSLIATPIQRGEKSRRAGQGLSPMPG